MLAVKKRKEIWPHFTSLLGGIRYRKPLLSLPGNFFGYSLLMMEYAHRKSIEVNVYFLDALSSSIEN